MSTETSVDSPAISARSDLQVIAIRTGTRCVTLTQLPLAFCAAAARIQCANNLRQLVLATHNYVGTFNDVLPPALTIENGNYRYWFGQIMPGSLEVDAQQFCDLAGWSQPYTLDQGLAATAAWWRLRHAM